jgi:hypothetical protein
VFSLVLLVLLFVEVVGLAVVLQEEVEQFAPLL